MLLFSVPSGQMAEAFSIHDLRDSQIAGKFVCLDELLQLIRIFHPAPAVMED